MGVIFGHAAFRSGDDGLPGEALAAGPHLRPVATANDLLRGRLDGVCVWLIDAEDEEEARHAGGAAFDHLRQYVFPMVKGRAESGKETKHYEAWIKRWWQPRWFAAEMFRRSLAGKKRFIVCASNAARPVFVFLSAAFVPTNTLYIFAFEDDYSFGLIQSNLHWRWTIGKGTRTREDISYGTNVWRTFPWPQEPTEAQVAAVAAAGRALRRTRETLMIDNGWTLRQLHQAAEVEGAHPLKDAQAVLDAAVAEAFGVSSGQDPMEFLLELNQLVAEDEAAGRNVRGPGLPDHLDPKDPRWMSADCIEPPAAE